MELKITGKNMELTPAVRDYIQRKLGKLSRHLPSILKTRVEVTEEETKSPEQRYVVRITVTTKGNLLHGEERGDNLFTAIDKVVNVMDRQVEHFKGKRYEKGRGVSFARGKLSEASEIEKPAPDVVKVESLIVKPMSVEQAIDQLELSGEDFFLFLDVDTKAIRLLYRRQDGNYGMIQPEPG